MINTIEFKIERRRVRYARISVGYDLKVNVILPLKFPKAEVVKFIQQKSQWIQKQFDRFKNRKNSEIKLNSDEILFLGEVYKFQFMPELGKKHEINNEGKIISSGENLTLNSTLDKWYKKEAKTILDERLRFFAGKYNFKYNKVFIRGQKTRWGSCSGKMNLSFNWRLIQTPMYIIDYIVVHELAHTTIFNHTKSYWQKVGSIYPNYKQANRWLKNFHLE